MFMDRFSWCKIIYISPCISQTGKEDYKETIVCHGIIVYQCLSNKVRILTNITEINNIGKPKLLLLLYLET